MTRSSLTPVSRPDAIGALALAVALASPWIVGGALRACVALWEAVPLRGLVFGGLILALLACRAWRVAMPGSRP
jgi:hypothetical protein